MVNEATNRGRTLGDGRTLSCPSPHPFLHGRLQISFTPAEETFSQLSLSVVRGTESESER
jgi:hypothetical protein